MQKGYWRTHSTWAAIVVGVATLWLPATSAPQHDATDSVTVFVASAVQRPSGSGSRFSRHRRDYASPPNVIVHNASKKNRSEF